jgi:hypothetical protein
LDPLPADHEAVLLRQSCALDRAQAKREDKYPGCRYPPPSHLPGAASLLCPAAAGRPRVLVLSSEDCLRDPATYPSSSSVEFADESPAADPLLYPRHPSSDPPLHGICAYTASPQKPPGRP